MRLDFSNYKFRCSSLGKIMTGVNPGLTQKQEEMYLQYDARYKGQGRSLTENQKAVYYDLGAKKYGSPKLSTTTKSYLEQLHLEEVFGRRKEIQSKYLDKGIMVEEDSLTLYTEVTGELFVKNKTRFENEYITGEPDNKQGNKIRDIKSSWELGTFPLYDSEIKNKDYIWQLMGYMILTGYTLSELIYCLVDTPLMLIEDEKRRISWKMGMLEITDELSEEIERSMTFQDIPKEMRVKVFNLEYSEVYRDALYKQIDLCREYLNSLSEKLISSNKNIEKLIA